MVFIFPDRSGDDKIDLAPHLKDFKFNAFDACRDSKTFEMPPVSDEKELNEILDRIVDAEARNNICADARRAGAQARAKVVR